MNRQQTLAEHFSHPQHIGPNRAERRAASKAAHRKAPVPQRSTGNPNAAIGLLRTTRAANSNEPLDPSQLTDLALGYHGALAALTSGRGTWDDCNTLACASNIAVLLCECGFGADELAAMQAAQNAVFVAEQRGKSTGRYLLTGVELRALQELVDLHDAQLAHEECTEGRIVAVLAEIKARKVAGNVLEVAL